MTSIGYHRASLPVLFRGDVIVVGGSFGGVAAALALSRAGRQVALVEPRTYLGREITATLRPWVLRSNRHNREAPPELISACLKASRVPFEAGEIPLSLNAVKTALEDGLLAAGVKLIYASLPVDLFRTQDALHGVVIGNKSGRQVLLGNVVLDATETALVARLCGSEFDTTAGNSEGYQYTLEFDHVSPIDSAMLTVPESMGIVDNAVFLHRGHAGQGNILVECEFSWPFGAQDAFEQTRQQLSVQQRTTDLAAYLLSQVPAFDQALLTASSYELSGPHTSRLIGPVPGWAYLPETILVSAVSQDGTHLQAPVSLFAGPVPGIWWLNEAARAPEPLRSSMRDPWISSQIGASLARHLHQRWQFASAAPVEEQNNYRSNRPNPCPSYQIKEAEQPQRGRAYPYHTVPLSCIPVVRTADALIVGGGTSGATAAITAAQKGMKTVLVEMNPGLGGTGTFGGIHIYWFGQRTGFAGKVIALVNQMQERFRRSKLKDPIPEWDIEAKKRALIQAALEADVEILFNALAIGAIVEQNTVHGVVVATRTGPIALFGKVIIDATGDGDLAAWAGAEYGYGSERDHAAMYAYLPQVPKPGLPRNVKTSMADISNIEDYIRMLLAERRRGMPTDHDHGIYLAPRESRHIKGDVVVTLTDQLLRRAWPDTVYFAYSNHDIKGETDSDWLRIGLQPPNLEIEIPYRAMLPEGLENILVVGKAYSVSHDGLAAPRMQADIENLGGIAALAATFAIQSGQTPRSIDIHALQQQLVEVGVLPQEVLNRHLIPIRYPESELRSLIDALRDSPPLYTLAEMEIGERYEGRIPLVDVVCAGAQAVPLLEDAFHKANGDYKVLLAQALAMLGSQASAPCLVSTIQDQLAGSQLPERKTKIRYVGLPPDQAAAPEVVYLINALGMARTRSALPVYERIVEMLATVTEEEVMDKEKAFYYYVRTVCYGAELLGDPAAVPILKKLHSYPLFHNLVTDSGFQVDTLKERIAFLELVIGRALARCGSPDGYIILINYLDDVRALLAEHGHTELINLTGKDFGKNVAAWSHWLEDEGERLEPKPWLAPTDPIKVWDQFIETTASAQPPNDRAE